jgi:predicted ATP-binding protein involved in virulence
MKIRSIRIENYKIFKNFTIDFTHKDKALSLIVLAGINGSGKSTLLNFVYEVISKPTLYNQSSDKIIIEEYDIVHNEKELQEYQIGGSEDWEIQPLIPPFESKIHYLKTYSTDVNYARDTIITFIDKLIYEKDVKSSDAYLQVQILMETIFNGFAMKIEFNMIDKDRNIFFKNRNNEKIAISELSTGEQELITKAFSLYLDDIKDSVILIDEPESSLHPNWQNRILKIYEDFAIKNNNQIIIATHSPHIIASAKKESLKLLVNKNGKIEVVSDFEGSYGYEVQKVLLEIMDIDSLRNYEIEQKLTLLKDIVSKNNYKSAEFKKLEKELEEMLGRNDKDLMLLRLEIAKRRKHNEKN